MSLGSLCGQCSSASLISSLCPRFIEAPSGARPMHVLSPSRLVVTAQQVKGEERRAGSEGIGRRELMVALNATAATGSCWGHIVSNVPNAYAADLTQRIQRGKFLGSIQEKLRVMVKENQDLIPSLLQLVLNDAATYEKASKSGGPNGSIHFSSELNRKENLELAVAVQTLETVKKDIDSTSQGGPITWADLIQIAGQSALKRTFLNAAIMKCGGNTEKGEKLYSAIGSAGQWGQFDKQFGRSQATEPDPEGRVLMWDRASVADIKAKFDQLGFKPRQVAVMSIFLGPDLLATEARLASDAEIAPWVNKYQRSRDTVSQNDYQVDLITAFATLSTLGQRINYEAYTYAPPPFEFKV